MMQPFEVADDGDHREGSLDAHPFVPGPLCTQFQVLRDAVLAAEAQVTQGNRLAGKAGHEGMEVRIGGVERRPIPGDDLTVVVEQPAELDRSEEHTSELQSRQYLVCRLLLEKNREAHGLMKFPTHSLRPAARGWSINDK